MDPKLTAVFRAPGPFSMGMKLSPVWPGPGDRSHELTARARETPSDSSREIARLVENLTPRRFEVLRLVARGLTNREIAKVMGISANTVKAHLTGVLETLELTNRTEAAVALQDYETDQIRASQ